MLYIYKYLSLWLGKLNKKKLNSEHKTDQSFVSKLRCISHSGKTKITSIIDLKNTTENFSEHRSFPERKNTYIYIFRAVKNGDEISHWKVSAAQRITLFAAIFSRFLIRQKNKKSAGNIREYKSRVYSECFHIIHNLAREFFAIFRVSIISR